MTSTLSTPPRDDRAAVDKAMALLSSFGNDAFTGVGVSELARRADMSKSTAFRVLGMLQRSGAVERAGNAYRLGKLIHNLGAGQETAAHGRMRDALTPYLADLYELSRQTVHLAVLVGTEVAYLNKLYGHLQVKSPSRIGGRAPAYCTAVGKVLLAYNPEASEQVMASELAAWTPSTITDPEALQVELQQVRLNNLAYDREEILQGLNCIAAPVMGPNGRPVAALSVSGPAGKFIPESQSTALRKVCYAASRAVAAATARRQHQLRLINGS
ncbi:IclR family transcriptional regulator [Arthrobacter sp. AK01]|uniref:IclR family transcriptional regulator n=1 Tax=Micrococcaceae TaxID=1268 RepID=UPI001E2B97D0|nr:MULTISPECIES: IclR family transcriptional regulator [Micrococcaceae]MCD4851291.1 IclR family transcriptional regulator [Arthrobacter sp. AK01]MCP1411425.1 DNA-binding IclR family transcriptional regulator [Paenarthrobacter sp. A20]